jgi:trimethylamine--corrinoid protein Co-methyltransferase
MIDAAYAQVGKRLQMPTHTYLGASDSKMIDAQAGLESGMGALVGALAGINMISGAGMLDFLRAQSLEKLVIDAEIIMMVKRLLQGIDVQEDTLAGDVIRLVGHHGEFLSKKHTRTWFALEQAMPSEVIDRGSLSMWQAAGSPPAASRAGARVDSLLAIYKPRSLSQEVRQALQDIAGRAARHFGMDRLPPLPGEEA